MFLLRPFGKPGLEVVMGGSDNRPDHTASLPRPRTTWLALDAAVLVSMRAAVRQRYATGATCSDEFLAGG